MQVYTRSFDYFFSSDITLPRSYELRYFSGFKDREKNGDFLKKFIYLGSTGKRILGSQKSLCTESVPFFFYTKYDMFIF